MSRIATNVYTLRSAARDLLPRTSIVFYGENMESLTRSLPELARQKEPGWEVVLVHDGKLSGSLPSVKSWPRHIPLRLIETQRPCGKSRAINSVLDQLTTDYLLPLNGGDLLDTEGVQAMLRRLQEAGADTVGVYGNLELWTGSQRSTRLALHAGESSRSVRRLLERLGKQVHIAPQLLRTSALQKIGGCPTDYPGEGWLLPDTALALALLQTGRLDYQRQVTVRRTLLPRDRRMRHDERKIAQVLLRQAAKRLHLPK